MSTRSVIGILNEDKTVNSVYSHYDGYPEHNGYFLKNSPYMWGSRHNDSK